MRLFLTDTVRNPVSLVGMTIATATAWIFVVLVLLDLLGFLTNPYVGLLVFFVAPVAFIVGLLLIPIGAWWAERRRAAGADVRWPVIDLGDARQRAIILGIVALTFVNVLIVSVAGMGAVDYMESTEFCGQVCHTTMEPEFTAHQAWTHSQVSCVGCHVGPGAGSFVESKLAGARQLYHLATNQVPKPVPTPVRALGRTDVTCGGCHKAEGFLGDRGRVIRDYASDEANTETVTTLQMRVGGPSGGIHRHVAMDIEYVTDPKRESIPLVRVLNASGGPREFRAEGATEAQIAQGTRRRMDCTDCHNRPAHTMSFMAERAVDRALGDGRLPRTLPFIRREAVAAVKDEYPDKAAALAAIATRLERFYASQQGADAALVRRAVASTQDVWSANVFPAMRVTWGTYANHVGHVDTPGCFRCHDDGHKAEDGAAISQDCELCHRMQ